MLRRSFLLAMLLGLGTAGESWAADAYPTRPVRIFLGFPAGTSVDVIVRLYAEQLEEHFKQPFVVENRFGASGNIATQDVARASPDGYTLLAHGVTLAADVTLSKKLPFDLVKDLTPITFRRRSLHTRCEFFAERHVGGATHRDGESGSGKTDLWIAGHRDRTSPCDRIVQYFDGDQVDPTRPIGAPIKPSSIFWRAGCQ